MATQNSNHRATGGEIDPIWTSSRTARQIFVLGEVEKDISALLSVAASSISHLTLPQTDEPGDSLPQGGERSEQFVIEVGKYFDSRIAPSAINAPPPGFIPPSFGVSLPSSAAESTDIPEKGGHGLQEERVERDAWKGILTALTRLKEAKDREREHEHEHEQQQEIEGML